MGKYGQFIKAMQEKYMGAASGDGLDGVPLTAVAPSRLTGKPGPNGDRPINVPAGKGAGTGVREMGRSNAMIADHSTPAGIVEEDEMVVEADMVDKAGGPGRVREGLEVLADMKEKGVARSFATGTGSGTAGDGPVGTDDDPLVWDSKTNGWVNKSKVAGADTTQTTPGLDSDDVSGRADDLTKGLLNRDVSRFSAKTDKAMSNLEDIASGDSDIMNAVTDKSTRGLAGTQAARSSALGQNLAQGGVEGGAARVAMAMDSRQAGIEQTELRSDLAVKEQDMILQANNNLATLGLTGEQLEETKRNNDNNIKM